VSAAAGPARLGRGGEELARVFLELCGFRCVAARYRCPRGEIDLVVRRGDLLVFVEVKTRGRHACGRPEEAVGGAKLARLRAAARHYLWRYPAAAACRLRFDVIAVEFRGERAGAVLRHLAGVR
jgi:putative endonuclease